ncbi:SIR2 family protein [Corallococcus sp. CA053C]|uniref:SIR2 family NAD-dependent protein deacylase n=1 Tax=Corallococcus sp. CA053C TaxID=2316732 RepID=UPI000EA2907C|nr:SIR2 family protein [Corallococcus sp. CA053C]RKH14788.1 SIR2 family protein [Corallococcus sp. CA053C]
MVKPDWRWVAPRLASLYHRGLLVPFIGAGLSRPTCPGWGDFITHLETSAATGVGTGRDTAALIRRANKTVLALRHRGQGALEKAVHEALAASPVRIPEGIECLADIWWPLVITTNYDNLYASTVVSKWKTRPLVLGRSPMHCFQVGRVLREPLSPALWAIQGYLDTPCAEHFDSQNQLASELIVGHEEYRRVTHREPHFRRTFAEVYRNRSLLFVGSGLQEQYFLDLFSEIREFYGPNGHLHFAFAPEGELDVDFLLREFQVAVVEYAVPKDNLADHSDRQRHLRELKHAIAVAPTPSRWDYQVPHPTKARTACFSVESTPLPDTLEAHGCLAVSAGGELGRGRLWLSPPIKQLVETYAPGVPHRMLGHYVARYGDHPVFAVVAREERSSAGRFDWDGERTLAAVYWATRNLLAHAQQMGFTTVHAQLFASGPELDGARDAKPPFRPAHALAEMASAFGDFARAGESSDDLRMVVHVVDPGVYTELRRGRLYLPEFLGCEDLRIWVSIELEGGPPSYHHLHIPALEFSDSRPLTTGSPVRLRDIARMFHIPEDWTVDVWPSPQRGWAPGPLQNLGDKEVVFAAVAGSTVRFIAPGTPRD